MTKLPPKFAGSPPPQAARQQVDISLATDLKCDDCGNYTFVEVLLLKMLPALVSPTGKNELVPIQTMSCNRCGHVNKQFLPPMYRTDESAPTVVVDETPKKSSLILEK